MRALEFCSRLCAVLAGVLLVAVALMTCASLVGRNFLGMTIVGDFELSGAAAGAAIALFMPWCQLERGNIVVDFFTVKASPATRWRLDRLGSLLLAATMALLAWRTSLGGLSAWRAGSGTMLMAFPTWIVFAAMVPPLALTAVVALVQTLRPVKPSDLHDPLTPPGPIGE